MKILPQGRAATHDWIARGRFHILPRGQIPRIQIERGPVVPLRLGAVSLQLLDDADQVVRLRPKR
jgi:hypothetical protein